MIESDADIANATDEQLKEALNNTAMSSVPLYYKLLAEVAKRSANQEKQHAHVVEEVATLFNPRVDVSADAKYLWQRIFIWFWVIPLGLGILLYFVVHR